MWTQGVILRWHKVLDVTRAQSGWKAFQLSAQGRERAFDEDAAEDESLVPMCLGAIVRSRSSGLPSHIAKVS